LEDHSGRCQAPTDEAATNKGFDDRWRLHKVAATKPLSEGFMPNRAAPTYPFR
jgi:hypothetical protein